MTLLLISIKHWPSRIFIKNTIRINFMHTYRSSQPFELESGQIIPNLSIAYHSYGTLHSDSKVVWVFHAISANSDVMDWWPGLFGEDKLYDPEQYFIVCANTIGSPYGSSRPEDLDFPQFTVRDVVAAHQLLAEHLDIQNIHTAIGGSFGGYQALEFCASYTGNIEHLIILATSATESPWGIAIHESQRLALQSDPTFSQKGGGAAGMKAARSMAMLTYRSDEAFNDQQYNTDERWDDHRASSYIRYQGEKFVKRFDALCYHYLTKCLDTHNIGRGRGGEIQVLSKITVPTLVIGFTSDRLNPVRFQKYLAQHIPDSRYREIESEYGHDGFLVETEKIRHSIEQYYQSCAKQTPENQRTIMKFGGSSLATDDHLQHVLNIVKNGFADSPLALVVSARGKSTDLLEKLYHTAQSGNDFQKELDSFVAYQKDLAVAIDIDEEIEELSKVLSAIQLLRNDGFFAQDRVMAFGELISAKVISQYFTHYGIESQFVDARQLIHTRAILDEYEVDIEKSRMATIQSLAEIPMHIVPIITGYIASSEQGKTVTLGRNGSNYSATLIGSFIRAKEVQNWTDVSGVYSANPSIVSNAVKISEMSYREANELAQFGTNLLHPKTILPLMQSNVPLRIKSTLEPQASGTLIQKDNNKKGIKAVTLIEDVALVIIEGSSLLDKVGIDARIFNRLQQNHISVRMIAQASSENGIGFVINKSEAQLAELELNREFEDELRLEQISRISINTDIAIVAILGRHNYSLEKAIQVLRQNKIWMHLISNSISGEHISLVVDSKHRRKAVQLVHNQVFGVRKTLHVFAIGKGQVGGTLIDQIMSTSKQLIQERNLEVKIVGVCDSQQYIFEADGISANWRKDLEQGKKYTEIQEIIKVLKAHIPYNLLIADNTASASIAESYPSFLKAGYDVVASNKIANASELDYYRKLRQIAQQKGRSFYYETNVGAGLPIMDTLKHLYQSADKVTRIRGVFSGSLSYIFNTYSDEQVDFDQLLIDAQQKGYAEPDPREDLSGKDVARKLLILAREVGYPAQWDDIDLENLIPENLRGIDAWDDFLSQKELLNQHYEDIKSSLASGTVLRYIAEADLTTNTMKVKLEQVEKSSPFGSLRNADSLFEIYTESYGSQPIIIQGAGAGAVVTARGVYSDILKVGAKM